MRRDPQHRIRHSGQRAPCPVQHLCIDLGRGAKAQLPALKRPAINAALFLQDFVPPTLEWLHLDIFAWNDGTRPGRPAGRTH